MPGCEESEQATAEQIDMMDSAFARYVKLQLKTLRLMLRFIGLLVRYFFLRVQYVYLLLHLCLIKVAGALLIEIVKFEGFLKALSKEDRIMLAACVAVSIYVVTLVLSIRL